MRGKGNAPGGGSKGSGGKNGRGKRRMHRRQRARTMPRARSNATDIGIFVSDDTLIADGCYEAVGGKSALFNVFGVMKLTVPWTIPVPSADNGDKRKVVPLFYNVKRGARGPEAGPRTKYRRDWSLVAARRPTAHQPLMPRVFVGVLAKVQVRTVTTDATGHPLPEHARYSVIDRIVEVIAGGGPRR